MEGFIFTFAAFMFEDFTEAALEGFSESLLLELGFVMALHRHLDLLEREFRRTFLGF